jgi:hypothetical protein
LAQANQFSLCPVSQRVYELSTLMSFGLSDPMDRELFAQLLYTTQHHLLHTLSSEKEDLIRITTLLASNL